MKKRQFWHLTCPLASADLPAAQLWQAGHLVLNYFLDFDIWVCLRLS
jgi:hypothetical protein